MALSIGGMVFDQSKYIVPGLASGGSKVSIILHSGKIMERALGI